MGNPALFRGKIIKIEPTQQFSSGSSKREFWAEEAEADKNARSRPNILKFEVFTSSKGPSQYKANCSELDDYTEGSLVSFSYEARGHIWHNPKTNTDSCFNSLVVVTKISSNGTAKVKKGVKPTPEPATPTPEEDYGEDGDMDSMPF